MSQNIEHLKNQLKGMSTRAALVTLGQRYLMSDKSFIFDGQLYTVASALTDIPEYLLDIRCDKFGTIRFFGGPPTQGTWHEGMILTMLCDAVLFDENTKNMSATAKLSA